MGSTRSTADLMTGAPAGSGAAGRVRRRIKVSGTVQGVGFRPFVWRLATRLGLSGSVGNLPGCVAIEVEGPAAGVASLLDELTAAPPPLAIVTGIAVEDLPDAPADAAGGPTGRAGGHFVIVDHAEADPATRSSRRVVVPPDVAACAACLAEVGDPTDRRHRYPFTNCTDCGPRYSIIERLPYDRGRTTMRSFAMCDACAEEYRDPSSRRFHAQPNACPDCGPTCTFVADIGGSGAAPVPSLHGAGALAAARAALAAGEIVAVKGIGGYRLACDATNDRAVALLRARKGRPAKPFAVLVSDVAAARRLAACDEHERRVLESAERPIVLLARRDDGPGGDPGGSHSPLASAVAGGAAAVGLMLPDAPLHHLLCDGLPPLVMTSGNLADEPIIHDDEDVLVRLGGVADAVLRHDRPIHAPCDDSVVRCMAGVAVPLRRSRGAVPLVVPLGGDGPDVLAVGGDLKAAPCVTRGDTAICGAHVGDLGSIATLEALERSVEHLLHLTGATPRAVAVDLHPGWVSTAWARRWAAARGLAVVAVQHHEAHVAALVAEQGGLPVERGGPWIGVCFDGTGYGSDGTIRGGDVFLVDRSGGAAAAVPRPRRVAALASCPLPGGDAAAREPWRAALALLHAAGVAWDERLPPVRAAGGPALDVMARHLAHGGRQPRVGSMGRLFDAVASLAGLRQVNRHEAEGAIDLEAASWRSGGVADVPAAYHFGIAPSAAGHDGGLTVTWHGLVQAVATDVLAGVEASVIGARFHAAVARMVGDVCARLRRTVDARVVGLTGGVFQNALLTEAVVAVLARNGFETALHHRVPPNDGGLALGQAVLARDRVTAGATPGT